MTTQVDNLRIHFYGVQGSGSIFPHQQDRLALKRDADLALLAQVFEKLKAEQQAHGQRPIQDTLGGSIDELSLANFYDHLELPEPPIYGGLTSCFRVETADGADIVFDCGSGFRRCAQDIQNKLGAAEDREITIFGTHAHFDHTEGF
ncbi:MAG: hypothetical protein AAF197_10390, partial [Pseudomonadota bacterium]